MLDLIREKQVEGVAQFLDLVWSYFDFIEYVWFNAV